MTVRRFGQVLRLVAVVALGLTAAGGRRAVVTAAQPAAGQDSVVTVQGESYPPAIKAALANREPPALKRVYSRDSIPNTVTLPPVTGAPPLLASDSLKGRLQVGFSRDIPAAGAASLKPAALIWDFVDGGSVTAVSVSSPGAVAMRLAVAFGSLPTGTEVRFFGPGADLRVFGPVTPEQIRALTVPAEAGGPGVFWSPVVPGDTAGMEIFVPTGLERDLSFTIPHVSHQYQSIESAEKAAGSCNIDVACYSASWGTTARATAKISYVSGGGAFVCTGTLMNDTDTSTFIPYFMTAEHCIGTQAEASTINSYWNYQTTTCGGSPGSFTTLFGGATLLSHGAGSDHSFLRLNDAAPASAYFVGWTSATMSPATSMVGIHHPAGDVKKISFGVIDGIAGYGGSVTGSGGFLRVHWTAGVTEGGSSGSGIITGSFPNDRFVGTLKGGGSSCSLPTAADWYGRFDLVYPLIRAYLSPAPVITTQPASQTILSGTSATLCVAATGQSLTYRWYQGTSGTTSSPTAGITACYTTPALTTTTSFWVQVTNAGGSANSATATITTRPVIVTQPVSRLVPWGGTTTLSVGAAGSAGLVYQWYQGGSGDMSVPIAGATAASYTTAPLTAPTSVWVRVSNAFGSAASQTATVSLGVAGSGTVRKTDFNGDGQADIAVWRPSTGVWFILRSDGNVSTRQWGISGDVPVAGDYDGDNKTDMAIWRPSTGEWYVLKSSDGAVLYREWGGGVYGDVPVTGDYDGDLKTDFAIWRQSTGEWYVLKSSDGGLLYRQWGGGIYGDVPVPGDYDGDRKTDFAIWRQSTGEWYVLKSSDGAVLYSQWGAAYGDVPVPGDYDGDLKTDVAVWRQSTGEWYVLKSSNGAFLYRQWGEARLGDRPVAGTDDHDGDGKTDFTVWRAPYGVWYGLDSASGYGTYWHREWGISTDVPVVD